MEPGVSLAATALAHGINANVLRKWVVKTGALGRTLALTASPAALVAVKVRRTDPRSEQQGRRVVCTTAH
jgi:transposase-like protein